MWRICKAPQLCPGVYCQMNCTEYERSRVSVPVISASFNDMQRHCVCYISCLITSTIAETAGEASAPLAKIVNIPDDEPVAHEKSSSTASPCSPTRRTHFEEYVQTLRSCDGVLSKYEVAKFLQARGSVMLVLLVVQAAAEHEKKPR